MRLVANTGKDPQFVITVVDRLADASVKPSKNAMYNALDQAERKELTGDTSGAIERLDFVVKKMNGCGEAAANDDWIVVCSDQISARAWVQLLSTNMRR